MNIIDYTPIYSAVIKGAKCLVMHQSMWERRDEIARLSQTMSEKRAEEAAMGLFRIVRRKIRRFMTRVSDEEDAEPTPINWIINTRTYGMKIRYTTENIDWRGTCAAGDGPVVRYVAQFIRSSKAVIGNVDDGG